MKNSMYARKIFIRIVTATIATVIISAVTLCYFMLYQTTEDSFTNIKRYTEQRITYENERFYQVQKNHEVMRNVLVEKLILLDKKDPLERFKQLVVKNNDGSVRSPVNKFNPDKHPLIFIQKDLNVDAELRRRVVAINEVVKQYGEPWHHRFEKLYISSINKIGVLFWPEQPTLIFDLPADQNLSVKEATPVANIPNNPDRKTVWTNLYQDYLSGKWVISASTPVDMNSQHIATITNDIILNELLVPLNNNHQDGFVNMIINPNGQLIMHSQKMDVIKSHQGHYNINTSKDEHLKKIYQLIHSKKKQQVIIKNDAYDEFLAVGFLETPGWYFVTVFPHSFITKTAFNRIIPVLLVSLLSFLVLLFVINRILFSGITERLQNIIHSVKKITLDNLDLADETNSTDEIADLDSLFNQMSQLLLNHKEHLEECILQRTMLLTNSEKRFRTIFETMQDPCAQVNANGKILLVNQAAIDLLGYDTFDEVYLLESVYKIYKYPEERNKLLKKLQLIGHVKEYEVQLKKKDGSIITCEIDMVLIHNEYGQEEFVFGLIRDISKKQLSEQLLLQYSKELEDLFNYIPFAYVSYDREGRIVNCNNMALSMLGFKREALVGKYAKEFYIDENKEDIKRLHALLAEGKQIRGEEFQVKKADGEIIWIRITDQPAFGSHSHRTMFEDISKQKNNEKELTVAMNIAEKANAAKSIFISQISHELRTPLNAILGFAQIFIMDSNKLDEEQLSHINEITAAGQHLLIIIEDILDIAKIESGKLEVNISVVNVDNVIFDSLSLIKPKADDAQVTIVNHIQQELLVLADPTRLKQVILNIISNAVKYNSTPGKIWLESRLIDEQRLRLSIIDTGRGLSPYEISQLFLPFERLSHSDDIEGTGIGLVISQHLIKAMGGTIGVNSDSETSTGCEFWIEIPLSRESQIIDNNILIVDDIDVMRESIRNRF